MMGTISLAADERLCEGAMRLIGKSELFALARSATTDLRDAVLSLAAELEAAVWRSLSEAETAFPCAEFADHRVLIDLDARHCAVVVIQYELGIAFVEFAGPTMEWNGRKRLGKGAS